MVYERCDSGAIYRVVGVLHSMVPCCCGGDAVVGLQAVWRICGRGIMEVQKLYIRGTAYVVALSIKVIKLVGVCLRCGWRPC